jgi:DNA invertase Pin-like site-specific DNA recombinase
VSAAKKPARRFASGEKERVIALLDLNASNFTEQEWADILKVSRVTLRHWKADYGWHFRRLTPTEFRERVQAGVQKGVRNGKKPGRRKKAVEPSHEAGTSASP